MVLPKEKMLFFWTFFFDIGLRHDIKESASVKDETIPKRMQAGVTPFVQFGGDGNAARKHRDAPCLQAICLVHCSSLTLMPFSHTGL